MKISFKHIKWIGLSFILLFDWIQQVKSSSSLVVG